jgi:hypothetical protein
VHVPAEIGGGAIEPVVDQLRDLRAACERAVEHVVIDTVFGEQLRESLAIALLDGVAESAQHGRGVHGVLTPQSSCPAKAGHPVFQRRRL